MGPLTFGLDARPSLSSHYSDIRTTYLVRSLVTGMFYCKMPPYGVRATASILDAVGFPSKQAAKVFARELERTLRAELCTGKPPYTRIERKRERVDVEVPADDSSS